MSDLPYWEVRKRISALTEFMQRWSEYLQHSDVARLEGSYPTDDQGIEARAHLNLMINRITRYLADVKAYPIIQYREPPISGGRVLRIDVLQNLFRLPAFQIAPHVVHDYVMRAIGSYKDDLSPSLVRTLNPIWWLWRLVRAIILVPFEILRWAGFDRDQAEQSIPGKVFKFLAAIAFVLAGLIGFFDDLVQLLLNLGIDIRSITLLIHHIP
jgi:hypothetical protein